MNRPYICFAAALTIVIFVAGQRDTWAADTQPADPAQLEKRVAELEKQNKALLERIATLEKASGIAGSLPGSTPVPDLPAATAPAKVLDIVNLAGSFPQAMRSSPLDSQRDATSKSQMRSTWYTSEVLGQTVTITLVVDDVSTLGVIGGHTKNQLINGAMTSIKASCTPTGQFQLAAIDLRRGQTITLEGKIKQAGPLERINSITLSDCTIK